MSSGGFDPERALDRLRKMAADGAEGSVSLILRYLQEWLLRHIDGMDKQLGKALITKGYIESTQFSVPWDRPAAM